MTGFGVNCVVAEAKSLLEEGFKPFVEVQLHRSIDGCTLPCCSSAMAVFRSSVLAAAAMCDDGLQGVLAYLNASFAWGIKFETHLCCMLKSPEQLDCGAMTGIAILALQLYLEDVRQTAPRSAQADLLVANVEIVMLDDPSNSSTTVKKITSEFGDAAKEYCRWIRNSVVYHQCVGLYSKHTGHLVVWDYGKWRVYLSGRQVYQHGTIAIKVNPVSADCTLAEVFWCGSARLTCRQWNMLIDSATLEGTSDASIDAPLSPTTSIRSSSQASVLSGLEGADKDLFVFISGCHMSVNPMTGVGLARSLRAWFSDSSQDCFSGKGKAMHKSFQRFLLVGVDDATSDPLCGLVDPVFDHVRSMMNYGKLRNRDPIPFSEALSLVSNGEQLKGREEENEEFWQAVISMLLEPADSLAPSVTPCLRFMQDSESFFLPCTDRDVAFFAAKKSALRRCLENTETVDKIDALTLSRCHLACERILCPNQETVALVEKPRIPGAVELGCFEVPEFLEVDPSLPLAEVMETVCAFCDRISYPVLIKASVNGATMCGSWGSVASSLTAFLTKYEKNKSIGSVQQNNLFVQKVVRGVDKTIAFAAFKGELTGCLLMTKTNVTSEGKVWSAHVESVDPNVVRALAAFVSKHDWTGGGEIEFIESLPVGLQRKSGLSLSEQRKWFIIDFNPRFPAWIYGGSFSGCNLPGDLIEHALRVRRARNGTLSTSITTEGGDNSWSYSHYLELSPTVFSRTVMEQPVANVDMGQLAYLLGNGVRSMKSTRGDMDEKQTIKNKHKDMDASNEEPMRSHRSRSLTLADDSADLDDDSHRWWLKLVTAGDQVLHEHNDGSGLGGGLRTPSYLLSVPMLRSNLQRHRDAIHRAVAAAGAVTNTAARTALHVQMCLSVKTQPHREMLNLAREEGYWAECISLAEVRAALSAGYTPQQIVLTGPGKFWEGYERDGQLRSEAAGLCLRGIYADSVSDLRRILQRLADPTDFLRAETVGVRFQPLGISATSRFGVDGSNPQVLRALAALVRDELPKDVKLGAHFHFAASAPGTGQGKWLGIAKAFVSLALDFALLCGRPLSVLDFGGGWHPHAFDSPSIETELSLVMTHCAKENDLQYSKLQQSSEGGRRPELTIMFELGKSLSERGGAVICRVLEVRELALQRSSGKAGCDTEDTDELRVKSRALIVDTTIAEVSVPHMHPLFWRPASCEESEPAPWQMLSRVGPDEVWGRTCMEFDVLVGSTNGWGFSGGSCGLGAAGICIPADLRAGDFLLVCGCGAYDMSMQYDFGDGRGRSNCVVAF